MDQNRKTSAILIGAILIVVGILSLFSTLFTSINWDDLWPLAIIGIGILLFVLMVLGGKARGGLAVPGSILIAVGLIYLIINITGREESWAYAWALIISAAGLGNWIYGTWSDQPALRAQGQKTASDGLVLFLVLGTILEFIFSYTNEARFGSALLCATLLALLGMILFFIRVFRLGKPGGEHADLFWPVLMVGAGIVAVLAEMGWLPKENLSMLLSLWPLLLIVAGVSILLRTRTAWVGASLGVFVVAAIFIVSYWGQGLGLKTPTFWPFDEDFIRIGNTSTERINGSGNVVTENRPVSSFDRVELSIPAELEIQQGQAESLTVTGEDNLLPLLVTQVSGGKLTIRYKTGLNVHPTQTIQIKLTVKNLKDLQNSSTGAVTVKPLMADEFYLELSSSGNIEMEDVQADTIHAEISSSGDILIKGSANQLDLRVSSSGNFQAGDLHLQEAKVRLTSSGEITLWVDEMLNANISSSGNVSYYGNPKVTSSLTSSGRVISKGEK